MWKKINLFLGNFGFLKSLTFKGQYINLKHARAVVIIAQRNKIEHFSFQIMRNF